MVSSVEYNQLLPGEEASASQLVCKVFDENVAPGFTEQGCSEFKLYAAPEAMRGRIVEGAIVLAARYNDKLVGIAEIRSSQHLGLLFVDSAAQGKGIGKELIEMVFENCRKAGTNEVTVNSSPNSRTFYKSCGFVAQDEEQLINGIRFVPMTYVFE